jgi:hypothetical protein
VQEDLPRGLVEQGAFRNGRLAVASEDRKRGTVTRKDASTVTDNATTNSNRRGRAVTETMTRIPKNVRWAVC